MLKCLNAINGEFITILDPQWKSHIPELRDLDSRNKLVCPYCHQPVRPRFGKIIRWHFAHKHLQNCPFQYESPLLLQTRAILYEWLLKSFDSNSIFIEKTISDFPFPRHIDCWVELVDKPLLFWIFDTRRTPSERENLNRAFKMSGANLNLLFTTSMLHSDQHDSLRIFLTTTERAFMLTSPFDETIRGYKLTPGKSLHYIDLERTLTTYRNLHLVHQPQEFAGFRIATPIDEVNLFPESGEFMHPGELEKLRKVKFAAQQLSEKQQRTLPYFLKQAPSPSGIPNFNISPSIKTVNLKNSPEFRPFSKIGVCRVCGIETSDWITFDGKNGTCLCRNCYNKGKSDTMKGIFMTASIAVQLYSVRQFTEKDFSGTVRKIAAMGYAGVEPAGFPGTTAQAAGKLFKELGLAVSSAHTGLPVGKDQAKILEEMDAIGCKRLVCPGVPTTLFESMDGIKKAAHQLNEANQVCRAHGMTLGYHNHYKEFQIVENRTSFDILLDFVDPDVFFQVDTYWAHVAGVDVIALIKKLGKRAPLLHIKDGPGTKDQPMLALGEGVMNIPALLNAAKNNCEWQIVELDSCATDMLEAVQKSYQFLANLKV